MENALQRVGFLTIMERLKSWLTGGHLAAVLVRRVVVALLSAGVAMLVDLGLLGGAVGEAVQRALFGS